MSLLRDIPLFPLGTVLFPGGRLPLRIFEPRYMDMAKVCLKEDAPFGVCLIAGGRETGAPALPHAVGTLARIVTWDMPQLGVLQVMCRGERRFRILERRIESSGLQRADIEVDDEPRPVLLEQRHDFLAELLARILDNVPDAAPFPPLRYDDAVWVGHRLAELLPMRMPDKQSLLELDDPAARFDKLRAFLAQEGLLNSPK